jgi:glycerophosphoryl diester phosphodiesterase
MVKVIAHRGYSAKFPENSIKAFKKAFYYGADGVECDLQKTKDGKFVIIHNDYIFIKNKKVKVNSLNYKQLSGIIPTLEQLLSIIPKDKLLNLELKADTITIEDCPLIFEIIKNFDKNNLLISSFSYKLLFYFKNHDIKVGLLFGEEKLKLGFIKTLLIMFKLNPQYYNLPYESFKIIPKPLMILFLIFIKLLGKKIAFWVINNEKNLKKIIKFSDIIITDEVEYIKNCIFKIKKKI